MAVFEASGSPPPVLQLLADPHRWRLLVELSLSDRRVGELSDLLGRPQNLVSYHLGELRNAGLVAARKSSADRRDTYYRAELGRCRELLGAVGSTLHPALRSRPDLAMPELPPRQRRAPLVLFLCTGNSARSQMAEALLEHHSRGSVHARSAGSHPKALHPNAVRAMAERGIDISGGTAKHMAKFAHSRFDLVITLCDKVKEICPEFPGQPATAHWSMPDPAAAGGTDEGSYPAFQRTAEELEARIGLLIERMAAQQQNRRMRGSRAH